MSKLQRNSKPRREYQEHCIALLDGTKVKRFLSKDCIDCDPLNIEGYDGEYFTNELGEVIPTPDLTGAICCEDVKMYESCKCMSDVQTDGSSVEFQVIQCLNLHTGQLTEYNRTSDLSAEYIPTGTVEDCHTGDLMDTETLTFCDSETTFYRVIDKISGTIIRQFSTDPNTVYVPTGEITAGPCMQSSGDCCETQTMNQGVLDSWEL